MKILLQSRPQYINPVTYVNRLNYHVVQDKLGDKQENGRSSQCFTSGNYKSLSPSGDLTTGTLIACGVIPALLVKVSYSTGVVMSM